MRGGRIVAVVLIVLALVGGGAWLGQRLGDDGSGDGGAGSVPTSPRTLAALVVDVLDVTPDDYGHEPLAHDGAVGVQVSLGPSDGYDDDSVALAVWEAAEVSSCEGFDGCEQWGADGGTYRLGWDEVEPEEDPGLYVLEFLHDGVVRSGSYSGGTIESDPREQDLPVDVAVMERLVRDDRLGLTAPRALDEADVPGWPGRAGETPTGDAGVDGSPQDLLTTGGPDVVATSPKTLASLAVEVLDLDPDGYDEQVDIPGDGPGVSIRINADDEYDGDTVALAVAEDAALLPCASADRCATWKADGGTYRIGWELAAPEEDPGSYWVQLLRDGVRRTATYAGAEIEGDPRRQVDLPVGVAQVRSLLSDPRLGLTAPRTLEEADLAGWPG